MILKVTLLLLIISIIQKFSSGGTIKPIYDVPNLDVIVIGAGPAGIAAATKLNNNGINVKILEAEPRYGGRVHSIKFGNAMVDLGGEWCHGEGDNIVYNLVKDMGVLKHPNYTFTMYSSDGSHIAEEMNEPLMAIFEFLYSADGQRNSTEEDTVASYFTNGYYNAIHKQFSHNQTQFEYAQNVYHAFNLFVLSSEGALSWFEPSALSDYKDCEGDHTLTWDGFGYKTVLDKLLVNFDIKNNLLLNNEVKHVIMDDENDTVKLILSNGESLQAKHVIFTPSVGVLKERHRDLFTPPLPKAKIEAIEAIGIGGVMKVLLEFPERWWTKNASFSGYTFVWTHEDRNTLAVQTKVRFQKFGLSWLTNFMGVYRVERNPNVLSCWFTGEFVPDIEKMNERDLIQGIMFTLNKFFGNVYNVQKPIKIERTKWYNNPHFRGTYSYQTIASRKIKPSANGVLGEPILNKIGIPKILFAGEATHTYYYSTVHGAIESGFREADRLINLLCKNNKV